MKILANILRADCQSLRRFATALGSALCLLIVAGAPRLAHAQEFRATLTGQVTDATGAVIPKAVVTATNDETGSVYTAESSDAGVYYIPYVLPGNYTVKATATGFKTAVQDKVLLLAGKYFGQNFKLEVGAITEKVEVTDAPPMLETANGSGGTILDSTTLENVPVSGRQVYNLISTTPGSQQVSGGNRAFDNSNGYIIGGGVSPTGQDNTGNSGGFNQFTLNGTNITQQISYGNQGAGTWNVSPTLDSVQEVNVMADTYDARYGRTTGGTVNVVTKNGTNAFHGELIENYNDGKLFDANTMTNTYISGLPTQQQVINQFGGNVGGPILKNKVWFFFSFEGYRQSTLQTITGDVPPAYLRPGYNGNAGVDFGLVQTLDPGLLTGGVQSDPYVLYGLTLFQSGDSTNPTNPNNAICGNLSSSPGAPASACGTGKNIINFPNTYGGGTNGGSLIPASQLNPTAAAMLGAGYLPLPNVKGLENYVGGFGEPANFFAGSPDVTSYNQPMVRVDYNTSDKTKWYSFFGMQRGHEYAANNGLTGIAANNYNSGFVNKTSYTASQDMTHTFSPTLLADFKLSVSRFQNANTDGIVADAKPGSTIGINITPPPTATFQDVPEMEIAGFAGTDTVGYGHIFGNQNDLEASTNISFDGDVTWQHKAHNVHLGGGVSYYTYGNPINGTVANNANGEFSFSGQWTQFDPLNGNCYMPASQGLSPNANCSGTFAPNGSPWADFLLGLPSAGHVNWNDSLFDYQPVWNLYGQDDWRINHRLTINLGLRYDVQVGLRERYNELPRGFCKTCVNPISTDGVYQANVASSANQAAWAAAGVTVPTQVVGTIAPAGVNGAPRNAYDTDWSNIAPRIGFAYALNPKTVVRGGWGLFYGGGLEGGSPIGYQQTTNYLNSTDGGANANLGGAAPGALTGSPYGVGTPFPATATYPLGLQPPVGIEGLPLAGVGNGGLQVDSPLRKIPRTQDWTLGFERELPDQMALDVHFHGNYGSRFRATQWTNGTVSYAQLQYAVSPGSSVFSQLLPNPYYNVPSMSFPGGCGQSPTIPALALILQWSQYCGFNSAPPVGIYNAPIGKNWYNALEVKLSKHTSHGLTFNLAYTYSKNMDGSGYQNGYPYQDANEVHYISEFDRTHVLAITGVYELPVGRGRTFLSGMPKYADYAIGGWMLGWNFGAQSGSPIGLSQGFIYLCPLASPKHHTVAQWLNPNLTNPSCYASAPSIGGTGYTYVTTPSYSNAVRTYTVPNLDLSLQKTFKVTERISFSLRGEAFNSLNSVLLGGPDTTPTDGAAAPVYNAVTNHTYWSGFGAVGPNQDNTPRNLRVSGRINF
jgi:hypothetical protein